MIDMIEFDEFREKQLRPLVDAKYARYAKKVIWHIKRLPKECRQSGDDSVLDSVWEEFKYQIQRVESVCFDVYVEEIRSFCRATVEDLPRDEQGLLWLWSDASCEWDVEREGEKIPYGDPVTEALEDELYSRVCSIADDEELTHDPDAGRHEDWV